MPKNIVIAIVDDDEAVRQALQGFMKSLGYNAKGYPSADEFLHDRTRQRTDCLIADVQMPGMTGPELYARLVASGEPIPTILITAYPDERARVHALEAGVKCYLAKPFEEDDLLACLKSVLSDCGQP